MQHATVLRGRHVVLEPLRPEHAEGLAAAIAPDDDVYRWLHLQPRTPAEMRAWIADRCADRPPHRSLAFAQRQPATLQLMGSTSIFGWDEGERCAEVGHTWLAQPFRRTGANTEAKLLLLTHCFEALRLARVQLCTDARNRRSRDAIERTGARLEGVLRRHRRGFDGQLRDTAYYSIVEEEWLAAKAALQARLR